MSMELNYMREHCSYCIVPAVHLLAVQTVHCCV
jgi:hypothetical protein